VPLIRLLVVVALAGGLFPRRAVADPPKVACAHGAEEGQRLRAQGKLREAREAFTACAAERCPALIRSDCSGWLAEVEAAVPTVVVRASAAEDQQRELYDVEVRVDGVILTSRLDGRELPLNPGEHHFSFSAPGRATAEDDVVIRVGEKHRLLTVNLPSTHPVPPPVVAQPAPPPPPRVGAAAKVLLIGGGVALVTAAAFGTSGWLEERSLRRTCAPRCDQGDVDSARLRLRIADVSLAAGVVALASAGVLIWTRPAAGPTVGVAPLAGGALVAVRFGSRE
jgi:hypothetical protein